jgi:hypothetical protein
MWGEARGAQHEREAERHGVERRVEVRARRQRERALRRRVVFELEHRSLDAVLTQPAIVSVPVAFTVMAGVSLLGPRGQRPPDAELLALHVPEGLGLGLEEAAAAAR